MSPLGTLALCLRSELGKRQRCGLGGAGPTQPAPRSAGTGVPALNGGNVLALARGTPTVYCLDCPPTAYFCGDSLPQSKKADGPVTHREVQGRLCLPLVAANPARRGEGGPQLSGAVTAVSVLLLLRAPPTGDLRPSGLGIRCVHHGKGLGYLFVCLLVFL